MLMLGLIILRIDPIIPKGRIIVNFDLDGVLDLVILKGRIVQDVGGLDPVIPKGRIVLNVDLVGLDPVIPKGRIVQDVDVGIDHPQT